MRPGHLVRVARFQLAASLYRLGDLDGAWKEAQKMYQSGLNLGDGLAVDILSKATCGRVARAVIQLELDRPRDADAQTASQVLQAEGVRRLAEQGFRRAAEAFQRGWETPRRAGISNTYVVPCLPWLATSLRLEADRLREANPAESNRLLRQAQHAARRGIRAARKFQNDLPHGLRELGLLATRHGRFRAARLSFTESLAVADCQGARYEQAQTALAIAELDQQLGMPGADQRATGALAVVAKIGRSALHAGELQEDN